jgi:TPR repeat protein
MNILELHQKAEAGSIVAQTVLGVYYLEGIEVPHDYQKAFRYLSAAAKRGASRAVLNLARMYAEGLGVPKDPDEAVRLYEAIGQVEFLAAIELGRIYSRGLTVPVDETKAARWYSAAVAQESNVADCDELREARAYLEKK